MTNDRAAVTPPQPDSLRCKHFPLADAPPFVRLMWANTRNLQVDPVNAAACRNEQGLAVVPAPI